MRKYENVWLYGGAIFVIVSTSYYNMFGTIGGILTSVWVGATVARVKGWF